MLYECMGNGRYINELLANAGTHIEQLYFLNLFCTRRRFDKSAIAGYK